MESKNNWKGWLYLAPVLILMIVFTFYPLINTIVIAFLKEYNYARGDSVLGSMFTNGITLENFGYVLGITPKVVNGIEVYYEPVIKYAIPNTFIIVFVTVPLSIIISLLIAVALNSIKALTKVFQTIFFVPYVTNAIAIGMVFSVIFAGHNGLWNTIFHLGDTYWVDMAAPRSRAMFALCVYIIWHALPYKILIFLSGLQGIDKQYYQAAKIDAASKFKTFMNVTVPLLSPQIVYVLITSLIGSFKEYSSVVGLFNQPGTSKGSLNMLTIVYYIYKCMEQPQQLIPLAAAAAVILFIIILIFTAIQKVVTDKKVHY